MLLLILGIRLMVVNTLKLSSPIEMIALQVQWSHCMQLGDSSVINTYMHFFVSPQ